jgi:hypothetical protein
MLTFTTFELEAMRDALVAHPAADGILTTAERANLLRNLSNEIARRDRNASERNIEPGARPAQYALPDGAIITRYEKPMPAQGIKGPEKPVKINIDALRRKIDGDELESLLDELDFDL